MMARASENQPSSLGYAADANLRYIRAAMDSSGAFTSVPGRGTVAVGLIGSSAGLLVLTTPLAAQWLITWLAAALLAAPLGAILLARKASHSGTSLASGVGRRFLFALLPGLIAAALLTWVVLQQGVLTLIPGLGLLLYGSGVCAGGALSVAPVRSLGISCMLLGAASLLWPEWGQVALLLGFGASHLLHGAWIWSRHGG